RLHCVNTDDGRAAWARPVAGAATGEVLLTGPDLLVFDGFDRLTSMSLGEGGAGGAPGVRWAQAVRAPVGMPAQAYERVLVSGADGVTALRRSDGKVLWKAELPAAATTGPVITGSLSAVGTQAGLAVLVLADGHRLWSVGAEPVAGSLIRDDDYVAWSTASGRSCVYTWLGKPVMRVDGGTAGVAPMLLGGRALCVIGGNFECVDLAGFAEDREAATDRWYSASWLGRVTAGPVLADSHVYFGTARRGLVCVRPRN
ncbi:MAG: outer membrane protein assembly factor BamB family protein, partial [Planctomycetota bacterium]